MINPIGALFGRSPIRPIQEHMAAAQDCVVLLGDFLEATFVKDWQKAKELQQAISAAENRADEIKRDIRTHLPRSLLLPVARTDLLELLRIQDNVADLAEDVAGLMLGRKMEIPDPLIQPVREYYQCSLKTAEQALKAINQLDELLETGFSGRVADIVEELIVELGEMETRSDVAQVQVRSLLFQQETKLPPVNVMFLYKIIDMIGNIADISHRVGSRILLLTAH